jgi:prepilin-type processing-associated H-X9-DG protein
VWSPTNGSSTYSGTATDHYYIKAVSPSKDWTRRPIPIHNGGLNVVYCDGHAKWSKIEQFLGPLPLGYAYGDPKNSWDNK